MIGLLKEIHNESLEALRELKFSKRDEFSRTVLSLYCTLIEQSWSLMLLANEGRNTGMSAILRSFLEAFVDIENLLNDSSYLKNLNAAYHNETLKFLKAGAKGHNPYLAGMSSVVDLKAEIAKHEAKLAELEAAGFKPLKFFEAFVRAKMEDVYRAVYNRLSSESHNNISALIARHFEPSGEDDFELVAYRDLKPDDFEIELDTAAGVLIESGLRIHQHFESPGVSKLEALKEKLSTYRKARDGT